MFQGDYTQWGLTEVVVLAVGLFILWKLIKLLKKKPKPTGPPCKKCGIYWGVSMCMYCKEYFCQTHMFRGSHKCQGWMVDRTPLGGLQTKPKQ